MKEKSAIMIPGIVMPVWLERVEAAADDVYLTDEKKLRLALDLAFQNVQNSTGGPFGAALFDAENHLVAAGVNLVVPSCQSWAHAEMTALARAQYKLGKLHLDDCTLASSCEPCAMCMGAIPWSGVSALIYGASGIEAEKIGFDEGAKPADWRAAYEKRGIRVNGPLLTGSDDALRIYGEKRGTLY